MLFTTLFLALSFPLFALAAPARKRASDTDILVVQFARVLELLETDFYTKALAKFQAADFTAAGFSSADLAVQQFNGILTHETAHITALEDTLRAIGAPPIEGCSFNFDSVLTDVATMAAVGRVVENVGVSAYLGGAQLISDVNILSAAASIVTIEARHQSTLNILNAGSSVPQPFDVALSPNQVLALAGPFITGCTLPIPANPSLTVTTKGTIGAGSLLTFTSPGIDTATAAGQDLSCQMLVGGAPLAISLPLAACVVPDHITGPVYIFITNVTQPLQANLKNQFQASIIAGPTLAFLDNAPELLGQLARGGSGAAALTQTVSPAVASSVAAAAPAQTTPAAAAVVPAPAAVSAADNVAPGYVDISRRRHERRRVPFKFE